MLSALPNLTCRMGDIILEAVDAIVNAANTSMLGGGGAIHHAAGPDLLAFNPNLLALYRKTLVQ